MMGFIRNHPNYIIGFFVWLCAILSILFIPKLIFNKGECKQCDEYSKFISSLSIEQKANLEMLEMGVINIGGEYFLVGDSSEEEYDLYDKQLIHYKPVDPIIDEKIQRMVILNSIMRYLPPLERDLIINKKAAIIFRNGGYVMVYNKNAFEAIN